MNNSSDSDKHRLKTLLGQFQRTTGTTATDRTARDQLLDELQQAVGFSGIMAIEKDIVRKAEQLLQAT